MLKEQTFYLNPKFLKSKKQILSRFDNPIESDQNRALLGQKSSSNKTKLSIYHKEGPEAVGGLTPCLVVGRKNRMARELFPCL
jgi:hypothetical protein